MTEIVGAYQYPVKGLGGMLQAYLDVRPDIGVVGDRVIAIWKKEHAAEDLTKRPLDLDKSKFWVCATKAETATVRPKITGRCPHYRLAPGFLEEVAVTLRVPISELVVQYTDGEYHMGDTRGAQASFLNVATHQEFEKFLGHSLNVMRWRANFLIKGLPAFAEYDWYAPGRDWHGIWRIDVGPVRMRIDDLAVRCMAPNANPETGKYDTMLAGPLKEFMERNRPDIVSVHHPDHRDIMGVYGVVETDGRIILGNAIRRL